MRCENNLMETTLKKNMSLYEEDQQPEGGRWRKILRYVLIAVILAIVIQMLYAGVLFLLAWRAEGSLQTASSYKQIEKSFKRVIKAQQKVVSRYEFYEDPFKSDPLPMAYNCSLGSLMQSAASSVSEGVLDREPGSTQEDWPELVTQDSTTNTENADEAEMDQILTKDGLIYVLYYNDGSYIRSNATDQEGATDQLYILREKNGICEEVGKVSLKINDPYQNASSEDDLYGDESASYEDGLMWCGKSLLYVKNTRAQTYVIPIDVSDPQKPQAGKMLRQNGQNLCTRVSGEQLIIASVMQPYTDADGVISIEDPQINDKKLAVKDVYWQRDLYQPGYTLVCSYRMADHTQLEPVGHKALAGTAMKVYMSGKNVYVLCRTVAKRFDETERTGITKFVVDSEGTVKATATHIVKGIVGEGFAVKEQGGHLWLCMSVHHYKSEWKWKKAEVPFNWKLPAHYTGQLKMLCGEEESSRNVSVYALDDSLQEIGTSSEICKGETVQCARFLNKTLYLVVNDDRKMIQVSMAAEADPQVLAQIKLADEVHYLHLFPSDPSMIFSLGKTTTGELDMTVFQATEGSDIKQVASYGLRQHDSSALADHTKILVQKTEKGFYLGFSTYNAEGLQYPLLHYTADESVTQVLRSTSKGRADYWCRGLFIDGSFYVFRNSNRDLQMEKYEHPQMEAYADKAKVWSNY